MEGIEKGMEKGIFSVALEMKNAGVPIIQISKFAKLSLEEIENINISESR